MNEITNNTAAVEDTQELAPVEEQPAEVKKAAEVQKESDAKPPKGSKYELISTMGFVGILLLLAIPVVGPVLVIIWALGGCRKQQKRNFARANLILAIIGLVIAAVVTYAAVKTVESVVEQLKEQYNVSSMEEVGKLVEGVVSGNFPEESKELIGDMIGTYIGSEIELNEEEKEQLDALIGAYVNGEVTIDKETLDTLLENANLSGGQ